MASAGMVAKIQTSAGGLIGTLGRIGKDQVVPALETFRKIQVEPALAEAGKSFSQLGVAVTLATSMHHLEGSLANTATTIDEFSKDKLGLDIAEAGAAAGNWVKEHPIQAGLMAVSAVTFAAPGLVSAPVLSVLGWGSAGPAAGTLILFSYNVMFRS